MQPYDQENDYDDDIVLFDAVAETVSAPARERTLLFIVCIIKGN